MKHEMMNRMKIIDDEDCTMYAIVIRAMIRAIVIRAKDFSPLRTQRMMVCRGGELHNDDIVGAGFARPHHRRRPNDELHNDDMVVGAKNFSPSRRLGCDDNHKMDCFAALAMTDAVVIDADDFAQAFMDCFAALAMTDAVVFADNQTSFLPNFDNKTTSVAGERVYNQPHYLITDVSSLRDLMSGGDVFSTDMSSLRDLPDDEHDARLMDCFAALANASSMESMTDAVVIDADTDMDARLMDCFAALANVSSTESMTDAVVISSATFADIPAETFIVAPAESSPLPCGQDLPLLFALVFYIISIAYKGFVVLG
jgi:hypothetical protein